jgi:hypothetical protein
MRRQSFPRFEPGEVQLMKKNLFRRKTLNAALAISILLCLAGSVFSQALAITVNDFVPFAQLAFVPCAAGGAGELVLISGILHIQQHITINGSHATIKSHAQPQGATGVGLTTGDKYSATGVTQEEDGIALQASASEFTFVNNFKIIGQGPDNNLLVHQTIHETINANGDVTVVVDDTSVECR